MSTMAIAPRISQAARKIPEWPVYFLGVAPAAWLLWQGITGGLGVDPVKAMEHQLGLWALQFLLASLCITPVMRLTRINLIKFRRPLGLLGAFYVLFHFLVWLLLDLQLRWAEIGSDLTKRPYIIVGAISMLILVPLAATSWNGAVKRMGAVAWGRLHRLSYVAVILGAVHLVMQEKVWTGQAIAYLTITLALVASRLLWVRRL